MDDDDLQRADDSQTTEWLLTTETKASAHQPAIAHTVNCEPSTANSSPMPTTIVIIANPTSGKGRSARAAEDVAARLRAAGLGAEVRLTQQRGDGLRLAEEAIAACGADLRAVVACGGDGTIQEIANVLAARRARDAEPTPALGLAPAGRCNDFARALGIRKDPAAIAAALIAGHTRSFDLGQANGRYFCTVITLGIDAQISRFVDEMRMPLKGTAAYLYGAACVLPRFRSPRIRIVGDFGQWEGPIFLASTANTSSYGGAIPIAPGADPADGMLKCCVIRRFSRCKAMTLVPAVLRGKHVGRAEVQLHDTRELTIDADTPQELWADGEAIAETPVTIRVVPGAIDVVVPAAEMANA